MNPLEIIKTYYDPASKAYHLLVTHSQAVAKKALEIAARHRDMTFDLTFVEEAALLHDIGIFLTNAPDIDCHGDKPYICHGYLGSELLQAAGYPRHALVCERHTGSGITLAMIQVYHLPLPKREMTPVSLEEKLICYADKFFSKSRELTQEKSIEQIRAGMQKFGTDAANRFEMLHALFR